MENILDNIILELKQGTLYSTNDENTTYYSTGTVVTGAIRRQEKRNRVKKNVQLLKDLSNFFSVFAFTHAVTRL